jgi:hypothetical protein
MSEMKANRSGGTRLGAAIPALPVADAAQAAQSYADRLGFAVAHLDSGFAIVVRDGATIHLWQADDQTWRDRDSLERPVLSGAESFIAGTASCRVACQGIDTLYEELAGSGALHEVSNSGVQTTDYGTREFHTLDLDGNLVTFFEQA